MTACYPSDRDVAALPVLRFSGRKTPQLLRFHVLAALVYSVKADMES